MIAGGIAYAAGDSIAACVNKSTGLTRIISGKMKCYKSERSLSWNQTGATGSQGATGATGPSGTSSGYRISPSNATTYNVVDGVALNILTATLPAGKYIFQLNFESAYFNNSVQTTETRYLECVLSLNATPSAALLSGDSANHLWPAPGTDYPSRIAFDPAGASANWIGTISQSQSGILEFTETKTFYWHCRGSSPLDTPASGQAVKVTYPTFTAIKVDSLTDAS